MINNSKGQEFWEKVKHKTYHELIDLNHAVKSNPNLHRPTPMSTNRENSYKKVFNDYNSFIKEYGPKKLDKLSFYTKYYIKHSILYKIYKNIKKS